MRCGAGNRHGNQLEPAVDYFGGSWEINKVTFKTPDYMLCSAQDHRPGQRGNMQHIWQATLGTDAVVFVNHPPFLAEEGSPNYWVGNLVLPRVAQWKDVLLDLRNCPPDRGLGFTHAYFPLHAFEEHTMTNGWMFARKADGYVALSSKAGLELLKTGRYAYRELRSHANQDVWICQLGSSRQDGSFADFQKKVSKTEPAYREDEVALTTIRGDRISFGWKVPLTINGRAVDLTGFKHYDNPYCSAPFPADEMTIRYGDEHMHLKWKN